MPPMNNRLMRPQRRRPDTPRILTANQTNGLTWTKPASNGARITAYNIYAGGSFLDMTDGNTTTAPELPNAGTAFQVAAVNAVGEGPKSRAVVAT